MAVSVGGGVPRYQILFLRWVATSCAVTPSVSREQIEKEGYNLHRAETARLVGGSGPKALNFFFQRGILKLTVRGDNLCSNSEYFKPSRRVQFAQSL